MSTVEVLETSTEIIEVIEQGPIGDGLFHNPMTILLASSKDTLVVPLHDGTIATELVIPFGAINDGQIDVTDGVMTALVALEGFSSNIEIHTLGAGAGNRTIQIAIWGEVSADDGVTWVLVPNSLHVDSAEDTASGSHTVSFAENQAIPAGIKTRLKCTQLGDAGVTLSIIAAPDLTTSTGIVAGNSTKATMFYREAL